MSKRIEIATPDLETIRAIGYEPNGPFGESYYVVGSNGMKHSWNKRTHGKHLAVSVRYRLRNEWNIPSRRIDSLLSALTA
jgi:hypothetical protein